MVRVIIAGTRYFNDYELLKSKMDFLLSRIKEPIEIVSGTARGADKLGEQYAKEKGYEIKEFKPNWDAYKNKAGYIRNKQMAEYATHCVCFWDEVSKGTESMIKLAQKHQLGLVVVKYKKSK